MHHSNDGQIPLPQELLEPLGATGKFPEGKLTPKDEGEIRFLISGEGGKVVLAFGKQVSWIGMNPTASSSSSREAYFSSA